MSEFVTEGGAKVVISAAPFEDAMALKNAIQKELVNSPVVISMKTDVTKIILAVDSSPVVLAALWPCLVRCTYNGEKVTKATFEQEKAREDYYAVVTACVKANLTPFLKGLLSAFEGITSIILGKETPK